MKITGLFRGICACSAILCACLLTAACSDMAKDDMNASLKVKVDVPDEERILKTGAPDAVGIATDPVPFPEGSVVHLKLTITNPDETHYIHDYVPGEWVEVMAVTGVDRVIDIEAYEIAASSMGSGIFPALHYITTTPEGDRTVSLRGEPVAVTITVAQNTDLGAATDSPPYMLDRDEAGSIALPPAAGCPGASRYMANIVDLDWDLSFPGIPVEIQSGGMAVPFSISGMPQGHNFSIHVWHTGVDIFSEGQVQITKASTPFSLAFSGYTPTQLTLSPDTLQDLTPGDTETLELSLTGGLSDMSSAVVGARDTCGGSIAASSYSFIVPLNTQSCTVHVRAGDCGSDMTSAEILADINEPAGPECEDIDGDGYFNLPGCGTIVDCDDTDIDNWVTCAPADVDGDGYFVGCDAYTIRSGPDCDDADIDNWVTCAAADVDGDGWFAGCDAYTIRVGPDCDDTDIDNQTSCATCLDTDSDTWFVGCDAYTIRSGPDCAPGDPNHWSDCGSCTDADNDDYGAGCDLGFDCDDSPATGAGCHDTCSVFYEDIDTDTYGNPGVVWIACTAPVGYTADGTDCNDNNINAWNTCPTCIDGDGDTWYGLCNQYITVIGPDCVDTDIDVYPMAPELCDGVDNQCTGDPGFGMIDENCPPWYVSETLGSDTMGAGSMVDPWRTIQYAVSQASPGDTINVAAGTYYENVLITADVTLLGGFDPATWNRLPYRYPTIVNGNSAPVLPPASVPAQVKGKQMIDIVLPPPGGPGPVPTIMNQAANGTIIDGFVIQNGSAGVANWNGTVTISNNLIMYNNYGVRAYAMSYLGGPGNLTVTTTLSHNLVWSNYRGIGLESQEYTYSWAQCTYYNPYYPYECQGALMRSNCYFTDNIVSTINNTIDSSSYYAVGSSGSDGGCPYGASPIFMRQSHLIRNSILSNTSGPHFNFLNWFNNSIDYSLWDSAENATYGGNNINLGNPAFWSGMALGRSLQPTSQALDIGDPAAVYNDMDGSRNNAGITGGQSIFSDRDLDGTPDLWEAEFTSCGLDPLVADSGNDPDGDTYTNLEEFTLIGDPCVFDAAPP